MIELLLLANLGVGLIVIGLALRTPEKYTIETAPPTDKTLWLIAELEKYDKSDECPKAVSLRKRLAKVGIVIGKDDS